MTRVMQPFQCDLQPEIPKHPITTHTHKHTQSSFKPPLHCGKKKRQTDRSCNRRTHEVPFTVACSHFTRKNTRFRAPASSPKHSPCNIMQPLQCGSQHQLANLHLSTHRTRPEQQMTRVMQPFQCDLQPEIPKHPITTHTQAHPKQLQATVTLRQKKRQTDRSRNRRTHEVPFIVACSHLTRKTTRFRAPASSPKHSPCNVMQPLQCGSQHQLANLHLSTHRTRPEQQTTRVMQPCQCDLQPEIPKHPIATHTQAHPKQLQATVTLRQKNDKPTAAATVAHTRYLSSSPAATLHGKTQGFVLRFPPQNIAHATSCKLAPICAQNNTRTADDKSHAAIPMRSATGDSKTPYNYAHTSTPKAASSHRYTVAKKTTNRPQPQPSHTRGTFHCRLQPLYTEKQVFVLRLPPQNIAHATSCSHYNAVRSINSQTCTYLRTEQHQNSRRQESCSHSNAICNRRFQNTL